MAAGRKIVAYSGGVASGYCIGLVPDRDIVYFNDTKWEHPDLYRFNRDIEKHYGVTITVDSDGRSPEEVFFDQHALGNNRMPICSRVLKAMRLQKYARAGDTIYFGISSDEIHRAGRIRAIYTPLGVNTEFPMIVKGTPKTEAFEYFRANGIEIPILYKIGFEHNNCSGGCVRAGKRSWARLWWSDRETYYKRAEVERKFNEKYGAHYSFIKGKTLYEFEKDIPLRSMYDFSDDGWQGECIGLCAVEHDS